MMNESNSTTRRGADILVVDSQLDDIRTLSQLLLDRGYKVRKALSGKMAITAIEMTVPDLILLSIGLSDIHPRDVFNYLNIVRETCSTPVILLGNIDVIMETNDVLLDHRLDYIIKPFRPEEILVRVANQLKLSRAYQEIFDIDARSKQAIRDRQNAERSLDQLHQKLSSTTHKLRENSDFEPSISRENRRVFNATLNTEWRRLAREQMPLSLILCEIDYFQAYNHLYDCDRVRRCLEQVARAIDRQAKRPADRVAHCGPSEFAVILPNTDHRGAVEVAKAIRSQIHRLQIVHERGVDRRVTLSLGVASTIPRFDLLPDTVVAIAREAVAEAKNRGGDRIGVSVNWR